MKRATKEEEGWWVRWEQPVTQDLLGDVCRSEVWCSPVSLLGGSALFQAAPVTLPFGGFQLDLLGSRHLKSAPTLRRWE